LQSGQECSQWRNGRSGRDICGCPSSHARCRFTPRPAVRATSTSISSIRTPAIASAPRWSIPRPARWIGKASCAAMRSRKTAICC
jgi:hypothetical protein